MDTHPHFEVSEDHQNDVEEWKARRVANLTSETGWLTLCGLYWLKLGQNSIGSGSISDVQLPLKCPSEVGNIILSENGSIQLTSSVGVNLKINQTMLKDISMPISHDDDGKAQATVITVGSDHVSFFVIKRGDKFGVRVKDEQNEARLHFRGIEYFAFNHKARVVATFHPHTPPKTLSIQNVLGFDAPEISTGLLQFVSWVDGTTYSIEAINETPEEFFLIFKDQTCGKESYGMKYLYASVPVEGSNETVIDFNKSYTPPCAFTSFATCPLAPRQNVLPFRIEAGEKTYDH